MTDQEKLNKLIVKVNEVIEEINSLEVELKADYATLDTRTWNTWRRLRDLEERVDALEGRHICGHQGLQTFDEDPRLPCGKPAPHYTGGDVWYCDEHWNRRMAQIQEALQDEAI